MNSDFEDDFVSVRYEWIFFFFFCGDGRN
jgi:hypothetical protein